MDSRDCLGSLKIARYRELLRLRDRWIEAGRLDRDSEAYARFCNRLMLIPEHTWGLNNSVYLVDFVNYSSSDLAAARARDIVEDNKRKKFDYLCHQANGTRSYSHYESAWQEQRDYLEEALQALPAALAAEARTELERMSQQHTVPKSEPVQPKQPIETNELYELGQFQVSFASDGSINRLMDRAGRHGRKSTRSLALICMKPSAKKTTTVSSKNT